MPMVSFVVPTMPVVFSLCAVWMVASLLRLRRREVLTPQRLVTSWVVGWYVSGVLAVTMLPLQVALGAYANRASLLSRANLIPLVTIDMRTFVLNLVMMVPLGILLPLIRRVSGWAHVARLAVGASASIELAQFLANVLIGSGRLADVNDLVANTLGAVAGFLMLRSVCGVAVVRRVVDRFRIPQRAWDSGAVHPDFASSVALAPSPRSRA
jgi:glycopeptide antibiotics resistance protein